VRLSTQYLRLTPRDTTRQKVLEWKLETPTPALRTTDGYGNVLHVLTIDKAVSGIAIEAAGTVETSPSVDEPSDFNGVPLSPLLFLRPTALTRADEALGSFAEKFRRGIGTLSGLRALAEAIHAKNGGRSAADAAHEFIACCRHLGVPSRYVSGYKYNEQVAMHAWSEAWAVNRWHSFDIAHNNPIGEAHIKIAVGADYLDACPVRGVRVGGGAETLQARTHVTADAQQ
jgi:Bacterial transglutaminase-like N-terminal region/Transglutaminase-like superfamily